METGVLSVFKYNGWIGKGKDGAKNPVDIPAMERGKTVIESKSICFRFSKHHSAFEIPNHLINQN